MFTRQGFENACQIARLTKWLDMQAKPVKLDIKRCEPSILFISFTIGSLIKLAIMKLLRKHWFSRWFNVIGNAI